MEYAIFVFEAKLQFVIPHLQEVKATENAPLNLKYILAFYKFYML